MGYGILLIFALGALDWELPLTQTTFLDRNSTELSRFRFEAEPKLKFSSDSAFSTEISARGWLDPVPKHEAKYFLDLRSAWVEGKFLPWTIRLGTQQIVWGEALHFFSADVLHPKDFRDLFLNSLESSRIPQTGILVTGDNETWGIQLIYFPWSRVNHYPEWLSQFSLPQYSIESLGLANPETEKIFEFSEPALAGNLRLNIERAEIHLMGGMIRDPQPYFRVDSARVFESHDRMEFVGLTLSYAWESILLRAESLLYPRRKLNALGPGASLTHHKVGELNSLGSTEYSGVDDVIVSLQIYWNQRYDCKSSQILPCRTIQENAKVLWMNLPWQLEFESSLWVEAKDPSFWWSNKIRRNFGDHLKAELSVEEFFGSGSGLFANLRNRDQVISKVEYRF